MLVEQDDKMAAWDIFYERISGTSSYRSHSLQHTAEGIVALKMTMAGGLRIQVSE